MRNVLFCQTAGLVISNFGNLFREHQSCVLGSPRVVKHHLLEFLSPISLHHGTSFLAAVAVAWQERTEQVNTVARKVGIDNSEVFTPLSSAVSNGTDN
jgi:hypothetical protein